MDGVFERDSERGMCGEFGIEQGIFGGEKVERECRRVKRRHSEMEWVEREG